MTWPGPPLPRPRGTSTAHVGPPPHQLQVRLVSDRCRSAHPTLPVVHQHRQNALTSKPAVTNIATWSATRRSSQPCAYALACAARLPEAQGPTGDPHRAVQALAWGYTVPDDPVGQDDCMTDVDVAKLKRLRSAVASVLTGAESGVTGLPPTYSDLRSQVAQAIPEGLRAELEALCPEIGSPRGRVDVITAARAGYETQARLLTLKGWLDAVITTE